MVMFGYCRKSLDSVIRMHLYILYQHAPFESRSTNVAISGQLLRDFFLFWETCPHATIFVTGSLHNYTNPQQSNSILLL